MARPSKYNEKIASEICELIAQGKSLVSICKRGDMPGMSTVFQWLADENKRTFTERYARAKQEQAEHGFERITEIINKVEDGTLDANQARTMIDAIKWQLGKLKPNKYSDKIHIDQDHNITIDVVQYLPEKCLNRDTPKLIQDTSENS